MTKHISDFYLPPVGRVKIDIKKFKVSSSVSMEKVDNYLNKSNDDIKELWYFLLAKALKNDVDNWKFKETDYGYAATKKDLRIVLDHQGISLCKEDGWDCVEGYHYE